MTEEQNPQSLTLKKMLFSNCRTGRLANIYLLMFYSLFVPLLILSICKIITSTGKFDIHAHSVSIIVAVLLIAVITFIFIHLRRCHDLGRSAWFLLYYLVPLVSLYPTIVLTFFKGDKNENKYGISRKSLSTSCHIVMLLILFAIIAFVSFIYSSPQENWQRYKNNYYSIELPFKPKLKALNGNTPGESLTINTNQLFIQSDYINYSWVNTDSLKGILTSSTKHFLSLAAEKFIPTKVMLSKTCNVDGSQCREIVATGLIDNHKYMLTYKILIRHKILYEILCVSDNSDGTNDMRIAKHLIGSFKFIDNGFS